MVGHPATAALLGPCHFWSELPESRFIPGGKLPDVTDQVNGGFPPCGVISLISEFPALASCNSEEVLIDSGAPGEFTV
jgi:hypothetical protein